MTFADPIQGFRRVFQHGFSVHDVAEPLASFDAEMPASLVRQTMIEQNYEIAGVREKGLVTKCVHRDELNSGICADAARSIQEAEVIDEASTLADLVLQLRERQRLFVLIFGRVGGIVSRTDVEKPAARMWLFGMITLIEMRFADLIHSLGDESHWRELLSENRLAMAQRLREERARRHSHVSLLDCLQFADKAQIIARNQTLRARTRFTSRRQLETVAKRLERLRNHLAHVQEITLSSWDIIVTLAENLDAVLTGPQDGSPQP